MGIMTRAAGECPGAGNCSADGRADLLVDGSNEICHNFITLFITPSWGITLFPPRGSRTTAETLCVTFLL